MRKILGEIISVLLVLALVFGAGYFVGTQKQKGDTIVVDPDDDKLDLKLPGETEKRVVTVEEIKTKLVEMDELSTYSGEYIVTYGKDETRHFFDDIAIPLTTNSIVINCEGIVKVGYNVSDINVKVDDEKIYISLPESEVLDNYVIWDSIKCDEDNNILNPIEFSQYKELIEEMEAKGLAQAEEQGIYDKAEENVKKIIEEFLACFDEYEIVYM